MNVDFDITFRNAFRDALEGYRAQTNGMNPMIFGFQDPSGRNVTFEFETTHSRDSRTPVYEWFFNAESIGDIPPEELDDVAINQIVNELLSDDLFRGSVEHDIRTIIQEIALEK